MPSLLSRFLGKKKNTDPSPLLDGEKYEAVPKTPSPSAPTFPQALRRSMSPTFPSKTKSKDQADKGLGIRRKQVSSPAMTAKANQELPMLSLSLPDTKLDEKKSQGLGVVFSDITDGPPRLDDEVLGAKRLTATETLDLVQKASEVISEQALGTLGVMRPHWFASSQQQEIQLQLISRFLQCLSAPQSNSPASGSTSPSTTFESELRYTRDPHDVAAVLRWGLRHLQLDGNSFGASPSVDWYRSFIDSERSASYSSKAFDNILVPLLPTSHAKLLRAILDLVSSLAAHSEENGISGNKLSKVLGWWVISSRNVQGLGWREFYTQWEAAARQFEHIFLAYIRAQEAQSRMPKRLTELVKNYPFEKSRREDDGIFLPRSRFSTRSASALLVRITTNKSSSSSRPHPLRIVEDAFIADAEGSLTGEYVALWQNIRKVASKPIPSGEESEEKSEAGKSEVLLNLSNILADETIRLLSLVPAPDGPSGPTPSLFTPLPGGRARRPLSTGDTSPLLAANGGIHGSPKDLSSNDKLTGSLSALNREPDMATDWQAFSNAGFRSPSGLSLAASLWDNDTEVSQPAPKKAAGAGKRNMSKSGSPRRASADSPLPPLPSAPSTQPGRLTYGVPQVVKLDEAFIDFWADTLLDTVARSWPTFVVCQLKTIPTVQLAENDKPVEWLVIERVLVEPTRSVPPPMKSSAASAGAASPTPASPTKSEGSKGKWTATTFAATRKRWSIFPPKHQSVPAVKGGKDLAMRKASTSAKVGEMGEILREEDEGQPNGVTVNGKSGGGGETKGVNGVNHSEDPKNATEKAAALPPLPVLRADGDFKPEGLTTTNTKEANVAEVTTDTAVDPTSTKDLAAVVKDTSEAKQTAEDATQPTQPPAAATSEPQSVIKPTPMEEPAAVPLSPQQELAVAAETVPAPEEPETAITSPEVDELKTSPKTDEPVSQPPTSTIPDPQFLEVPDANSPETTKQSSLPEDHPMSTTAAPVPIKAVPAEAVTTPGENEGSTEPEATAEQPPSEVPSIPDTKLPPPSEAPTAGFIVPESRQDSDRGGPASIAEPSAGEPIAEQIEAVRAPTQEQVPEATNASASDPAVEVEQHAVEEHAEEQSVEPTASAAVSSPDNEAQVVNDDVPAIDDSDDHPATSSEVQAQAESELTQPDVPEDHDAEPATADKDEVSNEEPVVVPEDEVEPEAPGEEAITHNTPPTVDDETAVTGDADAEAP